MLHLIDSENLDMSVRNDWCPVGRGVIPYEVLLPQIASAVRLNAIILEYEDQENPLASRPFLDKWLVTGGIS